MKGKPDTRMFQTEKDMDTFLQGADVVEGQPLTLLRKRNVESEANAHQGKITKIFNLKPDIVAQLKQAAYEQSVSQGRRVTETELVDAALRAFLHL